MVVYVELAFLQNFFLDGLILWLALKSARCKIHKKRLLFSAFLGGVFALLFPFLSLHSFLLHALKITVGFLLVLVSYGPLHGGKEWGRYAFTALCFFGLTCLFAGAITGVWGEKASPWYAMIGGVLLTPLLLALLKAFYRKKRIENYFYDCEISHKTQKIYLLGYYDSGNLATFQGVPVCFLSPDIAFTLFEEEMLKERGQVCDEIAISTMSGDKKLRVYCGKIRIEKIEKTVYFAVSSNIISRGYKLLLHSRIFEEETEKER